jgi:CBS domain containing-hemolysin-like protein
VSTGSALTLAVFLLAANAFFVGAEFALISARRSAIEPRAEDGSWAARVTLGAMERVSLMMAAAQLGITVCSLGLGYLGEPAVARVIDGPLETLGVPHALIHPIAFLLALSLISFLHVVVGEMVPKNIALAAPDRSALALGPPLALLVRIMRPVIALLNAIANGILRLVGVTPQEEVTSAFTRDEVAGLVEESRRHGLLDPDEGHLVLGALTFEERSARSVLLPLANLTTAPETVTPAELERLASSTGYSRFPISSDHDIIGYLHLKDVLEFEEVHRNRPIASSWIRPLPTVRVSDRLRDVLGTMQSSGAHLARVADEAGAVLGVVALEDVLEELVGEIRDEAAASLASPRDPMIRRGRAA